MKKIINILFSNNAKYGGTVVAAIELANASSNSFDQTFVLGKYYKDEGYKISANTDILAAKWINLFGFSVMPGLFHLLSKIREDVGVIHINGVWNLYNIQALIWAYFYNKPVVWTVHGELDPFRINSKPLKKKAFLFFLLPLYKKLVSVVRVITSDEKEILLKYGFSQAIFKIPNGVSMIEQNNIISKADCKAALGIGSSEKVLLFASRLSPEKGILELVEVFNNIFVNHANWTLVIAGSEIGASKSWLKKLFYKISSNDKIKYIGHWPADKKETLFKAADCFVLPSYSDVMSLVALEASLFGVPSAITKGCNFPELIAAGGAFQISHSTMHEDLDLILNESNETFRKMGTDAREFVVNNYNWKNIGKQMSNVYLQLMENKWVKF